MVNIRDEVAGGDPMTPEGRAELRRVAEAARDAVDRQDVGAMLDGTFRSTFDVPTVLALLDALETATEDSPVSYAHGFNDGMRTKSSAILNHFGITELPKPEKDEWGNPDFSNEHVRLTVYSDGCTQLEIPEYFGVNGGVHPFQLRDLAARCLAAANVSEARS